MRLLKGIAIVLVALYFIGCHTKRSSYLSQPEKIEANGPYTHEHSNMNFPPKIAGFQRVSITKYDENGYDISVGYNFHHPSHPIIATVYVYPAPSIVSFGSSSDVIATAKGRLCYNEFEGRKNEILNAHPVGNLILEKDVTILQSGTLYSGKMASFEYEDHRNQMVDSHLYIFCYVNDDWTVKYRFTHPKNYDARNDIEFFIKSLSLNLKRS